MKKYFLSFGLLLTMGLATAVFNSCKDGKDEPNKEQNDLDNPDDPNNPDGGGTETGLYLGIIGFSDNFKEKEIGLLNNSTKENYKSFVNGLPQGTATWLYYSVEQAMDRLQKATLPSDLTNVAIVTFTDGLDQGSIAQKGDFSLSLEQYLNNINNSIQSVKIKGLDIASYSIGIKGNDVQNVEQFRQNLKKIASKDENAFEVANMTEVNAKFSEIAASLYKESSSQNLTLKINFTENGAKYRFTFDNVTSAENSNLYVEGTLQAINSTSFELQNIVYQGLISTTGGTASGTIVDGKINFSFSDLKTATGDAVPTNKIQEFDKTSNSSIWQLNSEFGGAGSMETNVEQKSAVIVLVLDCSSSLGNQITQVKSSANNFIEILCASNNGETVSTPSVTTSDATSITQNSATLRGNVTNVGNPAYTERGFCYSTSQNPTTSNNKKVVSGSGTGSYSLNVTSLSANTTYYVRAFATNSQGTTYGEQKTFTTLAASVIPDFEVGVYENGVFTVGQTVNINSTCSLAIKVNKANFKMALDAAPTTGGWERTLGFFEARYSIGESSATTTFPAPANEDRLTRVPGTYIFYMSNYNPGVYLSSGTTGYIHFQILVAEWGGTYWYDESNAAGTVAYGGSLPFTAQ